MEFPSQSQGFPSQALTRELEPLCGQKVRHTMMDKDRDGRRWGYDELPGSDCGEQVITRRVNVRGSGGEHVEE